MEPALSMYVAVIDNVMCEAEWGNMNMNGTCI